MPKDVNQCFAVQCALHCTTLLCIALLSKAKHCQCKCIALHCSHAKALAANAAAYLHRSAVNQCFALQAVLQRIVCN